jgi:propionyl-CoA carboxylase alpha chain
MAPISKLLVANRGEIAARIIRSARALDIATVSIYSDPDSDAPYVSLADEAVLLPGAAPAETYLRGDLVIQAALATGADAVHPGYGFLSENAGFAAACADAGLVFVGPPVSAIEAMGSKVAAKRLMDEAGVPVLPGAVLDDEAVLRDPAALAELARGIRYPLLVKAAFGGGGRGMRIVRDPADLSDAVRSARREAESAFGDGTVFLERFVEDPRHIEVQIFGDSHGTVVHLFERECSVQRRFQKIVEEAPSPAVDAALRAELGRAAVHAGRAINYIGAGTVEFVMDGDGAFYFLEVNTRLQVEHPVTEEITGLDLVALQLQVAEGRRLPPRALDPQISGHAIEVRLYAEDPRAGYAPASGTLHRFHVPALPGIRVDSGVRDGSVVGTRYDPMLAKVIAHAPTRDEAARVLARALTEAQIHGLTTNRDLLVGILRDPEFRAGRTDTGYLDRHPPIELAVSPPPDAWRLHAAAAALAAQAGRRHSATVQRPVPSGWRNVPSARQRVEYAGDGDRTVAVEYLVGRQDVDLVVDGLQLPEARVLAAQPDRVDLMVAGVRRVVHVSRRDEATYCDSALGSTVHRHVEKLPEPTASAASGSLFAAMPGTVIRVLADAGEYVEEGAVVAVFEAMKMEHAVRAPSAGIVTEVLVTVGQTVEVGDLIAVIAESSVVAPPISAVTGERE